MKKYIMLAVFLLILFGSYLYVKSVIIPDEEYHKEVVNQVQEMIKENYPNKEIVEIRPRYIDKLKDKNKRYQVAVKYKDSNGWYSSYYIEDGKLVELQTFK
ncbi:hypothetical protein [Salinibacillus xinjiangensis]|uniref:DUF3139 domain-containing protein n=1 Tax=Salinibacillus xinjiangensis TaxID=1229268 RepID=A0A6G1X2Q9_9BACI|nr:hypothetical protein [Salinibacillus xinjiangensis]MRG85261.1 hypothetical protein [Salinibacillus xinjiangensis]